MRIGGPGSAEPVSIESPALTNPTPHSSSTSPPEESCAAFLPSAPCTDYTAISATGNNRDLPWAAAGVSAQLAAVPGALWLAVSTQCGPMSGPVTITGTTLTVGDIAIGASGCTGDSGEQQQWVLNFLQRPIEQTFSNGTLTWKSDSDTLNFRNSPGEPGTAEPTITSTGSISGPPGSPISGGGPVSCVDWVRFETPQDLYDNAGAVLVGRSVGRAGETSIYGSKAATHLVEVEQILKGDTGDGNLHISSMPPTCTGSDSYPDGDPLDSNQRVIIFAAKQGGEWFTLTPAQGVSPFPPNAQLPFHQ
nr:META domain-containing protein [Arthrobacter sp. Leaf141]